MNKSLNLQFHINTSKNKSKPSSDWRIFDDNNSPYYNEGLSPLYYTKDTDEAFPIYDSNGDKWTFGNGALNRNGVAIANVHNTGFKKTTLDIKGNTCYKNGSDYYTSVVSETDVTLFKNDEEIAYKLLSGELLTERWINGYYLAIVKKDNGEAVLYYYNNHGEIQEKQIVWWRSKTDRSSLSDDTFENTLTPDTFSNPIITYHDGLIYLSNISGTDIDADEFWWSFFNIDGTAIETINNSGVATRVNVNYTNTYASSNSIVETTVRQTKIAHKVGDKYYDTDNNEITFNTGYTPVANQDNTYTYVVYTTDYNYTVNFTETDENPSQVFPNTFSFSLNINDCNYPDLVSNKNINVTLNKGDISGEWTYNLHYENNFGFIEGKSFSKPEITISIGESTNWHEQEWIIPLTSFAITTNTVNQNASTYTLSLAWFSVNTGSSQSASNFILLDDGYIYAYRKAHDYVYGSQEYNNYNYINTYTVSNDTLTINSIPEYIASNRIREKICLNTVINLSQNYVRIGERTTYSISNAQTTFCDSSVKPNLGTLTSDGNATGYHFIDSEHKIMLYCTGAVVYNKKTSNPYTTDSFNYKFNNLTGSRSNAFKFKPLYNSNYIDGFSYAEHKKDVGTLLTGWSSIDTDTYFQINDTFVIYKNVVKNTWEMIEVTETPDWRVNIIEDRYIVLNTTSYLNCYDNKLNKMVHYASDWNNRVLHGFEYDSSNNTPVALSTIIYASGENVVYSQNESGIVSALFPALNEQFCYSTDTYFLNNYKGNIEYFESELSTGLPEYLFSIKNDIKFTNERYISGDSRVTYVLSTTGSVMYNPSLFTKFIYTGNNIDFMIEDGYSYILTYDNAITPILLASSNSYLDNMEGVYVIQSNTYGFANGKIYALTYANGSFTNADSIINAKGMVYVGSIPTEAYFFSPLDHSLYAHTGDCNFTKIKDMSAVNTIYKTFYNTATQTIYMATDNGLYMINSISSYRQEFYHIEGVYFIKDGSSFIVNREGNDYVSYHINYEKINDDYITNKVKVDTGLLGGGANEVIYINRYLITLWNHQHDNGEIKLSSYTLTDKGSIEKSEKTIDVKKTQWDSDFDTYLISYVPQKQVGEGVGLKIESDFAIASITVDIGDKGATTRPKYNI